MQFLLRFVAVLFLLLVALAGFAYVYLQDAERLKPEVAALISEQTQTTVSLNGPMQWALFPPLTLKLEDVIVIDDNNTLRAGSVSLKMDLSGLWQDVNRWRVTDLTINEGQLDTATAQINIDTLTLTDFALGEPATLSTQLNYQNIIDAEAKPVSATLTGNLTYFDAGGSSGRKIAFDQLDIDSNLGRGVCSGEVKDNAAIPAQIPLDTSDDLIPVATLLQYTVIADCKAASLIAGEESLENVDLKLTNVDGFSNAYVEIADFLGGSAMIEADVDLTRQPIAWVIRPEIENVDTQRLLAWRNQSIDWAALFTLDGNVEFTGNSMEEVYQTINSEQNINGTEGLLDISLLKQQLLSIAALAGRDGTIANWPERWQYQNLTGRWLTEGQAQTFNLAMDNISIDGNGTMDYAAETIDILANVTISAPPENSTLRVNDLLEGTPLPIRCTGATADVKCRLDNKATQTLIARALQGDDDTGLRRKIEDKIEEKVPEEFRDTARSLLDILGRALDDN